MSEIPTTAFPPCLDCGQPVDPSDRLALREVLGFARAREQGGQNHVRFRAETGRMLCGRCAVRWEQAARAKTSPAQETLL